MLTAPLHPPGRVDYTVETWQSVPESPCTMQRPRSRRAPFACFWNFPSFRGPVSFILYEYLERTHPTRVVFPSFQPHQSSSSVLCPVSRDFTRFVHLSIPCKHFHATPLPSPRTGLGAWKTSCYALFPRGELIKRRAPVLCSPAGTTAELRDVVINRLTRFRVYRRLSWECLT